MVSDALVQTGVSNASQWLDLLRLTMLGLRWGVDERHCLERVIDKNGVVERLIGVLNSVKKNVFLDRRFLIHVRDIRAS